MKEQAAAARIGPAPTFSGTGVSLDPELWRQFRDASSVEAYADAWLALQCQMITGVVRGVLLLARSETGLLTPVVYWPPGTTSAPDMEGAAETAIVQRSGVVHGHDAGDDGCDLAYPVLVDDRVRAVVAIELGHRSEAPLRAAMRQLQWGSAWLELVVRREAARPHDPAQRRLSTVLELVATCLEHESFQLAATATVTELATVLECDRVSVGFRQGQHLQVRAVSHSAQFGRQTNLLRAIGAAMDEAIDQHASVVFPAVAAHAAPLARAHADLAGHHGSGAVCTVPLSADDHVIGALTFERPPGRTFDATTLDLCEATAALVGPILELKRRDDRWLVQRLRDSARAQLGAVLGPRHAGIKLGATLLLAALLFFTLATGDHRVAADATLEGTVQRALVAPLSGYVAIAQARAGDIVREGDVLCSLDDRDLQLERLKWVSQHERFVREHREALAKDDRAQVTITRAQVDQAEAQLALVDEQLKRIRITAPFDGIVVTGDLSQSLGAPVERGDVLFEIAPLHSYRIILNVEERDIADVAAGQHGQLALASLPGEVLPLTVEKITPVATVSDGLNAFRVEARLLAESAALRPGMQGVGKIDIGRRRLGWIWTYKLVDRLRLLIWTWWP